VTYSRNRIGSLILVGFGTGLGAQLPLMAVQNTLKGKDIPIGTAVLVFIQVLAGAIFLSVCDSVFQQRLIAELVSITPAVDPAVVVRNGAANLRANMEKLYPEFVDGIILAYSHALQRVFIIALAFACLTLLGSASMEWVDVRREKAKPTTDPEPGKAVAAEAKAPEKRVEHYPSQLQNGHLDKDL
jgi:hypothetical protein